MRPLQHKFHLFLALSLLLLGWLQLQHELTAHLGHDDEVCEVCVFAGHLGNAALAAPPTPCTSHFTIRYEKPGRHIAPILEPPFRCVLSQRGPPTSDSV
ncbi:MAG: hypothetical protein ABW101_18960 [Candidatus Thiodiazotropha sp.]